MNAVIARSTARLLAAATSAVITLNLFSAVVSISEPNRSRLMTAAQHRQQMAKLSTMVAMTATMNRQRP